MAVRGRTGWLADLFSGWLIYLLFDQVDGWLIRWWWSDGVRNVERTYILFLPRVEPRSSVPVFHSDLCGKTQCGNSRQMWSFSVDLALYNSSHSLVPLCESMISCDRSVFLVLRCWNEFLLWSCAAQVHKALYFSLCCFCSEGYRLQSHCSFCPPGSFKCR